MSYSPVTPLIAEQLTEAYMNASFSGQLIYPSQLKIQAEKVLYNYLTILKL